ncbi:MAG: hypothetical protein KJO07_09300 [Deltaproteobacteria bacterium]|nr:hypothetical protein [Deltaproteobacteria bacterium]
MTRVLPAFIIVASLLVASSADAQPGNWAPAPSSSPQVVQHHKRSGLIFGFALGSGLGDDNQQHTGALGSIYVGGFINPKLAVMFNATGFDADSYCYDCNDAVADSLEVWGGAAQAWLTDRLWIKGTLGIGTASIDRYGDLEGLGWGAAAGIDLLSGNTFALDVRFDVIGAVFEEGSSSRTGLGIGFSWR